MSEELPIRQYRPAFSPISTHRNMANRFTRYEYRGLSGRYGRISLEEFQIGKITATTLVTPLR